MKKRMMKLAAISMSVLMAASLGACGSGGGDDKAAEVMTAKKKRAQHPQMRAKAGTRKL